MTVYSATTKDIVIKQVLVTLSNDQIKSLPTSKFELLPDPGENKILYFLDSIFYQPSSAYGYTIRQNDGIIISYDNDFLKHLDQVINQTGDANDLNLLLGTPVEDGYILHNAQKIQSNITLGSQPVALGGSALECVNKPIVIAGFSDISDPWEGGDPANTLNVIIYYTLIDIQP